MEAFNIRAETIIHRHGFSSLILDILDRTHRCDMPFCEIDCKINPWPDTAKGLQQAETRCNIEKIRA